MDFGKRAPVEKRREPRRKVLFRAELAFGGALDGVSGLVRDLSERGAKFVLDHHMTLPDSGYLILQDGTRRACAVIQRAAGREVGLCFTDEKPSGSTIKNASLVAIKVAIEASSPKPLFEDLARVEFCGDGELERRMKLFMDAYRDLILHVHQLNVSTEVPLDHDSADG